MDGTGVRVLQEVEPNSVEGLAVDFRNLAVYWSNGKRRGIFYCDLDGNYRQQLSPRWGIPRAVAALGSVAYWLEEINKEITHFLRTTPRNTRGQFLSNVTKSSKLQIIPRSTSRYDFIVNPCRSSPCSQICVQSDQNGHTCLCGDDYVLQNESRVCTGEQMLLHSIQRRFDNFAVSSTV